MLGVSTGTIRIKDKKDKCGEGSVYQIYMHEGLLRASNFVFYMCIHPSFYQSEVCHFCVKPLEYNIDTRQLSRHCDL